MCVQIRSIPEEAKASKHWVERNWSAVFAVLCSAIIYSVLATGSWVMCDSSQRADVSDGVVTTVVISAVSLRAGDRRWCGGGRPQQLEDRRYKSGDLPR